MHSDNKDVVTASGHVVLTLTSSGASRLKLGPVRLLADKLVYHHAEHSFAAEKIRLGAYPYYADGDSAAGTPAEIVINHATVSYGEPGPWQPTLKAEKIYYTPGQRLRTEGSLAGIGRVQPLPFPQFTQDLREPLISHVSLTGGFRSSLGIFLDAGLHLPAASGVMLGGDVAIYTNRGIMFGPSGTYSRSADGTDMSGYFRTGFIADHGNRSTDILGLPVPKDRAYIEWQHTQQLADNLTLAAQLNWWKDSEILRDFRPKEFTQVQEPDSFLESNYTGKNYIISAFARFQPNSFERVQERLPEIRFDLLPTPIGGGVIEQFNASYARLRERGPFQYEIGIAPVPSQPVTSPQMVVVPNTTLLQTDRVDAYYSLSRPIAPTDWFSFTPTAGGRYLRYTNGKGDQLFALVNNLGSTFTSPSLATTTSGIFPTTSQTRSLGELGFDAVLRASGTFDYKNEAWKIDGLRHLFTPRLSYRYVRADKPNLIPAIDRPVFSTYLQPLGLGDTRAIDTLESSNTLRLAFDNVLQTRDPVTGTRDLASLTVANDLGFTPGHRDVSGLQVEAALMPARWLQLDTFQRFSPNHSTVNEFNTGFTLHDASAWSVRFSNSFLRSQIEAYAIDSRARLNESYDVLARLQYDARTHRLNEQAYGLVQNLDNTWRISYIVSLYSGPRRESHFGLNVQIEATGF